MANLLNEESGEIREEGKDVNVIAKQLPVTCGTGTKIFFNVILWFLGIIPGIVFAIMKKKTDAYLKQIEQKIQHNASQIDNYLEQRVVILSNLAKLVDKAIALDKDTFSEIAIARSGNNSDEVRQSIGESTDRAEMKLYAVMENYPELRAHEEIQNAIKENSYLQKEITAAREVYNDTVLRWNTEIQEWPTKQIVAEKNGYTTRIPFIASKATKEAARQVFF